MSLKYTLPLIVTMFLANNQSWASETETLSLESLKQKCLNQEQSEQAYPFESSFTCKTTKTFWKKSGVKQYVLENDANIRIRAQIKDGKHGSEWSTLPGDTTNQAGTCDIMEKWTTTAEVTKVFHSCAELEAVVNEEEYCKQVLEPVWKECDEERQDQTANSKLQADQDGKTLCTYQATGITKSCTEDEQTKPQPICQGDSSSSSNSNSNSDDSSSSGEEAVQSCYVDLPSNEISEYEIGAELTVTTVNRGLFHGSHKVILVDGEVQKGGMLDQLGLKQGDIISRVNSKRTKDLNQFVVQITKAKAEGIARVQYSNVNVGDYKANDAWKTIRVENF